MLLRYAVTICLAGFITFGLFFMMQSLISMKEMEVPDISKGGSLDFVRLKRESATESRKRKLPKKEEDKPPPPPPDLSMAKVPKPGMNTIAIAMPSLGSDVQLSGGVNLGTAPADTEATPILKVPPIYPPRAQERGVEGWVLIEFTISPTGAVVDAFVSKSHPSSIFNRAALRTIRKWKYRPKIVDGVAVSQSGIRTQITFELND